MGVASDARIRLTARMVFVESKVSGKYFKIRKVKIKTNRNADNDSKAVSHKMVLPVDLILVKDNEPPIEKVMIDRARDRSEPVYSANFAGIIPKRSRFNKMPARIYPDIFGNFIFSAASPGKKPENISMPIVNIIFISSALIF